MDSWLSWTARSVNAVQCIRVHSECSGAAERLVHSRVETKDMSAAIYDVINLVSSEDDSSDVDSQASTVSLPDREERTRKRRLASSGCSRTRIRIRSCSSTSRASSSSSGSSTLDGATVVCEEVALINGALVVAASDGDVDDAGEEEAHDVDVEGVEGVEDELERYLGCAQRWELYEDDDEPEVEVELGPEQADDAGYSSDLQGSDVS